MPLVTTELTVTGLRPHYDVQGQIDGLTVLHTVEILHNSVSVGEIKTAIDVWAGLTAGEKTQVRGMFSAARKLLI